MNRHQSLIGLVAVALVAVLDSSPAPAREPDAVNSAALHKPRIVVTTDLGADPDDIKSLVRLLVSANEFDIEGLIVSTGCCKGKQSNEPPPTPGLRREGSRGDGKAIS